MVVIKDRHCNNYKRVTNMSTIEDISAMSKSFDEQQQPTNNNNIANDDERLYPTTKPDVENYALGSLSYDDNIDGSTKQQQNHAEDDDYDETDNRAVESLYTDLSCLCIPSCASRPSEICSRTGNWALANADQFISSIIVAISLIPESISYALIAGLPPSSALQSAWIMNIITAMVGGRPGMITSASGLAALLLARLVQTDTVVAESGIMFVPYVIGFAGCLQCVAAFFGWGRLVSSFSPPLVVGMVNAMAVLILVVQCRYAKDFPLTAEEVDNGWNVEGTDAAAEVSWNIPVVAYFGDGYDWISPGLDLGIYFAEVATAFIISMFLPRCTTILPATVVSVMIVAAVEFGLARNFGVETPLIGDYGGAQVSQLTCLIDVCLVFVDLYLILFLYIRVHIRLRHHGKQSSQLPNISYPHSCHGRLGNLFWDMDSHSLQLNLLRLPSLFPSSIVLMKVTALVYKS